MIEGHGHLNFQDKHEPPEIVRTQWGRIIACLPQLDSVGMTIL